MGSPLLLISAALAGGIIAGERWLRLSEREYLLAAAAIFLLAVASMKFGRATAAVGFATIGVFLAGAFLIVHWRHDRPADDVERFVLSGRLDLAEPVRLTGWISGVEPRRGRDEIYLLELERVKSRQREWALSGTVRLQHYRFEESEPAVGLRYGDRVSVLARLRPVRGFHNPGSFDREGRARREGVQFYASIKAAELSERLPGRRGSAVIAALYEIRAALLNRLDRLFPADASANGLLRAMLLGDRSGLDRRTSDDFQKTGTYHILVVSGLNAVAVAAPLLWLLRRLRVPMVVATLVTLTILAIYTMIAGANTPIVRAALMFGIYLLARLIYRDRALLNTIAVAAIILLVAQPADINDGGFQLSFAAVLLIAAVAVPLVERTSAPFRRALDDLDNEDRELTMSPAQAQFRLDMRMLRDRLRDQVPPWVFVRLARGVFRTFELVVVAAVVQIGFLLPMSLYFYRAALVSIPANLLIVPLVTIVVSLGMAALVIALVSTTLAGLLAVPVAALLEAVMAIARWHAALGPAAMRVPVPPAWVAALFIAAALGLAATLHAPAWRLRRVLAATAATATVFAATLIVWHPFPPQIAPGELAITALDVAQGDAILVAAPPDRVMLVDTGGLSGGEWTIDTGEQIVSPYLWARGIQRIHVVALTHAHHDHVAGLESILNNFQVDEIWLPSIADLEPYEKLARLADSRRVPVRGRVRGESSALGDAEITILAPDTTYRPARRAQNNDSLVMRISFGGRSALLAGDVERRIETDLIRNGLPLRADFLKTPHHGSKTSNSGEFLEEVRAAFGVISVAANSPFGHPHEEALARLNDAGTRVFRTDRDGAVTWATDGRRVRVSTFRWERGENTTGRLDLW